MDPCDSDLRRILVETWFKVHEDPRGFKPKKNLQGRHFFQFLQTSVSSTLSESKCLENLILIEHRSPLKSVNFASQYQKLIFNPIRSTSMYFNPESCQVIKKRGVTKD